jgi:hypothetical protein
LCNFLHSPIISSLLGPNILLSTLFSNALSLCSSLHVRDQVPHPYKTTGRIIPFSDNLSHFLYALFLEESLAGNRPCKRRAAESDRQKKQKVALNCYKKLQQSTLSCTPEVMCMVTAGGNVVHINTRRGKYFEAKPRSRTDNTKNSRLLFFFILTLYKK